MCAIFGFIARGDTSPNIGILTRIIRANIARGPHGFGMAWTDATGRLHCFKQAGRFTDHLGVLGMARRARLLVGHLRFATHGLPSHNINNHPHPADGGWIVHNGIVRNYDWLIKRDRLWPVSECDSEVLGLLIERSKQGTFVDRCAESVDATTGALAMMGIWSRPANLIIARRGNPLHVVDQPDGVYLASLRDGLGAGAKEILDNSIRVYRRTSKGINLRRYGLKTRRVAQADLFDPTAEYCGG